jgi:hypothetical protein
VEDDRQWSMFVVENPAISFIPNLPREEEGKRG